MAPFCDRGDGDHPDRRSTSSRANRQLPLANHISWKRQRESLPTTAPFCDRGDGDHPDWRSTSSRVNRQLPLANHISASESHYQPLQYSAIAVTATIRTGVPLHPRRIASCPSRITLAGSASESHYQPLQYSAIAVTATIRTGVPLHPRRIASCPTILPRE